MYVYIYIYKDDDSTTLVLSEEQPRFSRIPSFRASVRLAAGCWIMLDHLTWNMAGKTLRNSYLNGKTMWNTWEQMKTITRGGKMENQLQIVDFPAGQL